MALLDHFNGPDNDPPTLPEMPVHQFCAAMHLWSRGKVTRATMVARMGLDDTAGNDKDQLDLLEGLYSSLPNNQKGLFRHDLEAALECYEVGWIQNKAELATVLGI